MSGFCLTVTRPPRQRLDLSPLVPEHLAGMTPAAIAAIPLACGNRRLRVDEVFEVAPAESEALLIRNRGARLDFLGSGMTGGELVLEGDAGAYAGLAMSGGRLTIRGPAGPFAGAAMQGGILEIGGNAGDWLGGGLPGERRGMTGGLILLRGDAGRRAADRQRRGVILIEGNAGDFLGARMVAGTTIVLGAAVGRYPGFAMKRGTLLLRHGAGQMLPTFADAGLQELGFLRLLAKYLAPHSAKFAAAAPHFAALRRFVGDAASGGKGEILAAGD
ncbi:MAG TPA: formylmethanofuran dehydrogenase subunit C [Verrucomicrobiae bacterium]|nr:formylmethanofuran dehydrogenase subunit C [Verrucomicrobiae bacterium]